MDLLTRQPIVVDIGSSSIKAGFAGEDKPSIMIRSIVGRPKHPRVMAGGALNDASYFVGPKAVEHRGALSLSQVVSRGSVSSWSDLELLWNSLFDNSQPSFLTAKQSEHPLLIAEATLTPRAQRERLAQMLFEQIHVPALYISPSSPLSLYATGRTTGLVLDSGEGVTHATPIYEGFAVPHATLRSDYGGRDVTEWLSLLMRKAGTTLNSAAELETVKDIKESTCFVSQHPSIEEATVADGRFSAAEYRLPDGQRISVGAERFRAPEILFRPSLAGLECRGVADLVSSSIQRTDLDLRASLFSSIVLAGGSTSTKGFGARLLSEMRKNATSSEVKLRIWAPSDRQILTWVGGSILASLGTFKSLWVTKEQFEEEGPRCLHSGI